MAAVAAAPLILRCCAIWDRHSDIGLGDLRGVVSDLAVASAALALAAAIGRRSRGLALGVVALWVLAQYLNFEVVRELGSLASVLDLEYLGNPTFVLGSAIAVSRPFLLLGLLAGSLFCAWRGFDRAPHRAGMRGLVLAAGLFGVHALWPAAQDLAFWRQLNFVHDNGLFLLSPATREERQFVDPPAAMLELVPGLAGDLSGEPIVPLPGKAKNVLVVIIEGISGVLLPSLAADHGLNEPFVMQQLDAFAKRNLSFSTFVTHNRKTNRGVYSILCGEPPNLLPGTPKMTQHALGGWRVCLPEVLAEAGYETVYAQAAPLAFMLKGPFAKRAGFTQVHGYDHFDVAGAAAATHWGVDDKTLYAQSLELIDELRAGDRPWFMSLLTVGTHHPFVIPEAFLEASTPQRHSAYLYADRAFGYLVEELERRGVFDDTLVLITSDESQGLKSEGDLFHVSVDDLTQTLWQNWGFLVVSQPEAVTSRVAAPYSQMDLALSIVDYLGLSDGAGHFFGRSIFRTYQDGRFLPAANTNKRTASLIKNDGDFLYCNVGRASACSKWGVEGGRYFGRERQDRRYEAKSDDGLALGLAERSQVDIAKFPQRREIELIAESEFWIEKQRMLHGGSYINLKPGQWLEVELEVEAHGESGSVNLVHYFRQPPNWSDRPQRRDSEPLLHERVHLKNGEVFHLKYSVAPYDEEALDGVKAVSFAKSSEAAPFRLVFRKAKMRIFDGAGRPAPGVKVEVREFTNRTRASR